MKERMKGFRFGNLLGILGVFLLMAFILLLERMGVRPGDQTRKDPYLPEELVITADQALEGQSADCLVITDMGRVDCSHAYDVLIAPMLKDMKVPFDMVDIGSSTPPDFRKYETVLFLTPDMDALGDYVIDVCDWVKTGGHALFAMPFEYGPYALYVEQICGVLSGSDFVRMDSMYLDEEFILGGGQSYPVTDAFDSAIAFSLRESAKSRAWIGGKNDLPLIWQEDYGRGRFVVVNIGIYEKSFRGIYAAAYSLLEDVFAYPVLNGSAFYLDDMPSPVPDGDGSFIYRDYGMSISDFYSNVWFRDMESLSQKYGYAPTAVIIENYEDDTETPPSPQVDTRRFLNFGNQILRRGGELGYHGYNHQPLMPSTVDYGDEYDYNTWPSQGAMRAAMEELIRFADDLYPTAPKSVYVPPSNVMGEDGRSVLSSLYPQIRTVASTYLGDFTEYPYVQEFGVGDDGIVNQPRTVSGTVFDDFMMITSVSELNMHLVCTHFMHPDDTLDEDRGAALGWAQMLQSLDDYLNWLFTAAPGIRRMTGSELSGTIQRWAGLTVEHIREDNRVTIHLGNYIDEAYLLIRLQNGVPDTITGGTLTQQAGDLYLLSADQADIIMEWNR